MVKTVVGRVRPNRPSNGTLRSRRRTRQRLLVVPISLALLTAACDDITYPERAADPGSDAIERSAARNGGATNGNAAGRDTKGGDTEAGDTATTERSLPAAEEPTSGADGEAGVPALPVPQSDPTNEAPLDGDDTDHDAHSDGADAPKLPAAVDPSPTVPTSTTAPTAAAPPKARPDDGSSDQSATSSTVTQPAAPLPVAQAPEPEPAPSPTTAPSTTATADPPALTPPSPGPPAPSPTVPPPTVPLTTAPQPTTPPTVALPMPTDPTIADIAAWSDPSSWPSGRIPAPGASVTIPAGMQVRLDADVQVSGVTVEGELYFDPARSDGRGAGHNRAAMNLSSGRHDIRIELVDPDGPNSRGWNKWFFDVLWSANGADEHIVPMHQLHPSWVPNNDPTPIIG